MNPWHVDPNDQCDFVSGLYGRITRDDWCIVRNVEKVFKWFLPAMQKDLVASFHSDTAWRCFWRSENLGVLRFVETKQKHFSVLSTLENRLRFSNTHGFRWKLCSSVL